MFQALSIIKSLGVTGLTFLFMAVGVTLSLRMGRLCTMLRTLQVIEHNCPVRKERLKLLLSQKPQKFEMLNIIESLDVKGLMFSTLCGDFVDLAKMNNCVVSVVL